MIIAVDFDGTIVKHRYPAIGEEIPFAIETLKLIQSELNHKLILWSVREGDLLEEAVNYCAERGLHFFAANANFPGEDRTKAPRKLTADLFIDDRNFGGVPDWGFIYNSLKTNKAACFSPDIFQDAPAPQPAPKPKKWFW